MPRHFILGFMNLKTGKVDSAKTEEYPGFGKKSSDAGLHSLSFRLTISLITSLDKGEFKMKRENWAFLKRVILLSLPVMIQQLLTNMLNLCDTMMIGGIGENAISAVAIVNKVFFVYQLILFGLSNGIGIFISQYMGARQEDQITDLYNFGLGLCCVMGIVVTGILIIFPQPILGLFVQNPLVLADAEAYLGVLLWTLLPFACTSMISVACRVMGRPAIPMISGVISCLVNIVLDLLFVAVLDMGVAGAAIATIASQFFSAILTLIALLRTQDSYRLIVSKIRFHRDLLFDIIKIGLPAGLQSAMYSISNLLIQSSINSFGTDTIAAWTAYGKVDSIFWMIMGAYGVSITTFAGQNFGAGKYDRIKKSVRICLGLAAVTSLFLSFIVLNFGGTILLLFTRDANVIHICIGMMRVVSPAYITYICIEILSGTCRGCGDSFFPMLLTCFGVCVLRILWITIAVPLRHEVATVAFSYPLTWTITSILFILYYKRGKWMQKDTLRNAPQGQGKEV